MSAERKRFRAAVFDPGLINMGVAVVDGFGLRKDVRLVRAAEERYGKGCKQLQDIPCDTPDIDLISSEHWDVRNGLGSLAKFSNPTLKEFLEKEPPATRSAEYAFQVLSPNTYLHKYNTTPALRDTTARMVGDASILHEKYPSFTGNMELPALLAENQQDQVKNGKFDYRAPVYNVCNAIFSAVRGVDSYRGEYGRVILNHSKKWGIDRKSTSSDLNATEYRDRKNKSVRELFNLLAANGLTEWIEVLEDFEARGYKLDDRADAILIAVHYLMELYDAFHIRDGIKHQNTPDIRDGFTKMPAVLLNPLGRAVPKSPRKSRKKATPKSNQKAGQLSSEVRNAAFKKHLETRKREREEKEQKTANPRPVKRVKKAPPVIQEIIDMTKDDEKDGYISDTFVEETGISYEQLMDAVAKSREDEAKPKTRRRGKRKKSVFMGVLDVKYGDDTNDHRGQSKLDQFFKKKQVPIEEKDEKSDSP